MVTEDDTWTLRQITGASSIVDWAEKNLGNTHIGKRKLKTGLRNDKEKKAKTMNEAMLWSDESALSPDERHCLPYQESNLSTSAFFDDHGGDGGDYQIKPSKPPI
jgi:hypothetical protein